MQVWVLLLLTILLFNTTDGGRYGHHENVTEVSMLKNEIEKKDYADIFDDILKALGKKTKYGTQYEIFGCVLILSKDRCKFNFKPDDECKKKVSLGHLFQRLMKQRKLQDLSQTFLPISIFQIEQLTLDRCKGEVAFTCAAKEPFDLVKQKVQVKKAKLEVSLNYKQFSKSPSFILLGFALNGEAELNKIKVSLNMEKKQNQPEGKFSIKVDQITAEDFRATFSKKQIAEENSSAKTGLFTKAVIREPIITGSRDKNGGWEFVLKGRVTGIRGLGDITIFVIAKKPDEDKTGVAVVADLQNIQPAKILSTFTGIRADNIPLVKDLTADLALEIANTDMAILKDKNLNSLLMKYLANGKTISEGVKIKLNLPLQKIVKDAGGVGSLESIPKSFLIQMFINGGNVSFQFPSDAALDLVNILIVLMPKASVGLFNKLMKKPPNIKIETFNVNIKTGDLDIKISAPEDVTLANNLITIKGLQFHITHKKNGPWNFEVQGTKQIGDASLEIKIAKKGDKYNLQGEINELTIKNMIKHFGGENADDSMISKYEFLNSGIKQVKVDANFGGGDLKVRVTGNPVFYGWTGLTFEGIFIGGDNDKKMVLGIIMKNIRIDEIIEKILKKKVLAITWLSQITCSLMISNTDADAKSGIDFVSNDLKNVMKIKEGVSFAAEATIPDDCNEDQFCETLKKKLGKGTKLTFEGDITKSGVSLRGSYTGNAITFGKNLVLKKLQFVLNVGLKTEIYVEGVMKINEITLTGRLGVSLTGSVQLSLLMEGMWKKPFGFNYLSFGNVNAGIAINPAVPIPSLDFSAEVHVGRIGNGKEIKAQTAFGISPTYPLDNYFYAKINKLTLKALSEAFEFGLNLPDPVSNSGFPDGLLIGYSANPAGKDLKQFNTKIAGVVFKGTVDILGFQIQCDLNINFPEEFKLHAVFPIVNIAKGAIQLRKSKKDTENGPTLFLRITKTNVEVEINAFVSVLGISVETHISVSKSGYKFFVYGSLFGLFEANVTVFANYDKGKQLADSAFFAQGCISTGAGNDIKEEIKEQVTVGVAIGKEAGGEKLDEKTNDFLKKQQFKSGDMSRISTTCNKCSKYFAQINKSYDRWNKMVIRKEAKIGKKSRKIDKITKFLNDKCVNKCKDVCLGAPTIERKCKKFNGKWLPCPGWDDCKFQTKDLSCVAKCKTQKLYLERVGINKKRKLEKVIKNIKTIKTITEKFKPLVRKIEASVKRIEEARGIMTNVAATAENTMAEIGKYAKVDKKWFTSWISAIYNYFQPKLFNINHACFNASIDKVSTKCLGFSLDVTAVGKNYKFDTHACFDGSFLKFIAKAVARYLFPGVTFIYDQWVKLQQMAEDIVKQKEEVRKEEIETERVQATLEKNLEEEEKDEEIRTNRKRTTQRSNLPLNMTHIHKQIYEDYLSVTIRDDDTMDAFESRSPWAFSKTDSPYTSRNEFNVHTDAEQYAQKEDVPLDLNTLSDYSEKSSCKQKNATTNAYQLLSDGLNLLIRKLDDENKKYVNEKESFRRGIEELEEFISAKLSNSTESRIKEALYYVEEMRVGTQQWESDVSSQIKEVDRSIMRLWRNSLSDAIKGSNGIDEYQFMKKLASATKHANKRATLPLTNGYLKNLNEASTIIDKIFTDETVSLSTNRGVVEKLAENIKQMKETLICVN